MTTAYARRAAPTTQPRRRFALAGLLGSVATVAGIVCIAAPFTASIYLGSVLIVLAALARMRRPPVVAWLIFVFIGWCLLSSTWAMFPGDTLDGVLRSAAVALAAVFFANVHTPPEYARRLALAIAIVCAGSLRLAVTDPGTALADGATLNGLVTHSNKLGFEAAVGILSAGHAGARARSGRWIWVATGLLCAATLVLTGSLTSWLALGASLVACMAVWWVRRGRPAAQGMRAAVLVGAAGALIPVALFNLEALLPLLGRDPTFTGRTQIWDFVVDRIAQRPLTGYGLGLWEENSPFWLAARAQVDFVVSHAHNGLLELLLATGVVGVVVMTPLVVMSTVNLIAAFGRWPGAVWGLAVGVLFGVANLTEAYLTAPFYWLVLCLLWTFSLRLLPRQQQPQPPTPFDT